MIYHPILGYHGIILECLNSGLTGSSLESNTIRELPPAFRSGIWNPCCLQISRNHHAAFECDAWSLLSAFDSFDATAVLTYFEL